MRGETGGYFYLEKERGSFRGGEEGWCTSALGGCHGEGGAKYFFSGPKCLPRIGPTIASQKRAKDEKVYKPPFFSPEFRGFFSGKGRRAYL